MLGFNNGGTRGEDRLEEIFLVPAYEVLITGLKCPSILHEVSTTFDLLKSSLEIRYSSSSLGSTGHMNIGVGMPT